jgi:hypothetical protein
LQADWSGVLGAGDTTPKNQRSHLSCAVSHSSHRLSGNRCLYGTANSRCAGFGLQGQAIVLAAAPPRASPPTASRHPGAHGTQRFHLGQSSSIGRSHIHLGAGSRLLFDLGRYAGPIPSFLTRCVSCRETLSWPCGTLIKEVSPKSSHKQVPHLSHYVLRRAGTEGSIGLFTESCESSDPGSGTPGALRGRIDKVWLRWEASYFSI